MAQIIRQRRLVEDDWQRLSPEARVPRAQGKLSVPLARWRAERAALIWRWHPLGLWLEAGDDPAEVVKDLGCFDEISIRIERFSDGRAYSSARLLRERFGWRGTLRAFGDVRRDQLRDLERVGFDTFELRPGEEPVAALGAFEEIGEAYQASATQPLPLFRRRTTAAPARPTRAVFWGAPGVGKTTLVSRLLSADHAARSAFAARGLCLLPRTVQFADLFEGDEPLGNVVSESRGAGIAVVVVDVRASSALLAARYAHAAQHAGIGRILVAVNKMDIVGYDAGAFRAARESFLRGWSGAQLEFAPVSARENVQVFARGDHADWHEGPSLAELLGLAPGEAVQADPALSPAA